MVRASISPPAPFGEYRFQRLVVARKEMVMVQIRIENKRDYKGKGVYVGRPSILGNTFRIGRDGDRKTVIKKNLRWLREKYRERGAVYQELHRLAEMARRGNLVLICWCTPRACHAHLIAYILRELLRPKYAMGDRIAEHKKRKGLM
jgi:hypothetical protein